MRNMTRPIYLVGDVHGRFTWLNQVIDEGKPEAIIQLGDFGVWRDGLDGLRKIIPQETKIYFIPGNHENWDFLDQYELAKIHELLPNVFYCAFGSMFKLRNINFLCCGGADSIDKGMRTIGIDWWPTERITQKDMDALPNPADVKVDVVLSHTAPDYFDLDIPIIDYIDPSTRALSMVYDMYKPKRWFFAHFHKYQAGKHQHCRWWMLNCIERSKGIMTL